MAERDRTLAWAQDEQAFLAELARGRRSEFRVGVELLSAGLAVRVGRLELRDGVKWKEIRDRFGDQADVTVEERYVLEVKGRNLDFTGPDDFPFENALVGSVERWKARTESGLPYAIVLASERRIRGRIAIPVATRAQWGTETVFDRTRGYETEYVAVPRDCFRPFPKLVVKLLELAGLETTGWDPDRALDGEPTSGPCCLHCDVVLRPHELPEGVCDSCLRAFR